jgi:hypothetical protein
MTCLCVHEVDSCGNIVSIPSNQWHRHVLRYQIVWWQAPCIGDKVRLVAVTAHKITKTPCTEDLGEFWPVVLTIEKGRFQFQVMEQDAKTALTAEEQAVPQGAHSEDAALRPQCMTPLQQPFGTIVGARIGEKHAEEGHACVHAEKDAIR